MKILFILTLLFFTSCQSMSGKVPEGRQPCTATSLINVSKINSEKSMNAVTPQEKVKYAQKGIDWAEKCVGFFPKKAGCYFYRAVNTGLYYQAAVIRYQKGLKKIIRDSLKVIDLDEKYDGGGAYRILGNIYLKAPNFSLAKRAITKNLEKANRYAKKAMEVDSQDVGNRLLWAEILFEKEEYQKSVSFLRKVIIDFPKIKPFTWYDKGNLKLARKLLRKAEKRLTTSP